MDKLDSSTKVKLVFVNVNIAEEVYVPNDYKIEKIKQEHINPRIAKLIPDKTIYQKRLFSGGKELSDEENIKNFLTEDVVIHIHCNYHWEPIIIPEDSDSKNNNKRDCCTECKIF